VATRQLGSGGGMLAFELAGGRAAGAALIDTLTIPVRTASLGSVFTIVSHPPSTTHRQLDDAALAAAGITPGLLRCSVGLEDLDDLVADFSGALEAARATGGDARGATRHAGNAATRTADAPAPAEPTPV
jgi:O-acetylhomoserine (thiol)-lyase